MSINRVLNKKYSYGKIMEKYAPKASPWLLSSGYKASYVLAMYYLTKFDVIWSGFWVTPKITSANLCKLIHDVINYPTIICPFESGKCGKEEKKLQKFDYLENEKSFLDEIKNIFHSF